MSYSVRPPSLRPSSTGYGSSQAPAHRHVATSCCSSEKAHLLVDVPWIWSNSIRYRQQSPTTDRQRARPSASWGRWKVLGRIGWRPGREYFGNVLNTSVISVVQCENKHTVMPKAFNFWPLWTNLQILTIIFKFSLDRGFKTLLYRKM